MRRGGKAQGRGFTHRSRAEGERSEGLHKRSAEDWGNPCAAPGRSPQRLVFLMRARQRAGFSGAGVAGEEQAPLWWVAEDA